MEEEEEEVKVREQTRKEKKNYERGHKKKI